MDDGEVLEAVARILDRDGLTGLSISAIANEADVSRVTLHRRGPSVEDYVVALLGRVADELRNALWPAMTGSGPGADRLRQALEALCVVAEHRSGVMRALYGVPGEPLRDDPDRTTATVFAEPFERIVRDGCLDGSLHSDDPTMSARLVLNVVGWTYIHMRRAHGWTVEQATGQVVDLALGHLSPRASDVST